MADEGKTPAKDQAADVEVSVKIEANGIPNVPFQVHLSGGGSIVEKTNDSGTARVSVPRPAEKAVFLFPVFFKHKEALLEFAKQVDQLKPAGGKVDVTYEKATLVTAVGKLSDELHAIDKKLSEWADNLDGKVRALEVKEGDLTTDVGELKAGIVQLKTDIGQFKADVSQVKSDVGDLKGELPKSIASEVRRSTGDFTARRVAEPFDEDDSRQISFLEPFES